MFQTELGDVTISRAGDKLFCKFKRRKEKTFLFEDVESGTRKMWSYKFTMDDKKHVLVATGPVYMPGTQVYLLIH